MRCDGAGMVTQMPRRGVLYCVGCAIPAILLRVCCVYMPGICCVYATMIEREGRACGYASFACMPSSSWSSVPSRAGVTR